MNDKELERAKHEIRTTIKKKQQERIPGLKNAYQDQLHGMWNLLWAMGYRNEDFMTDIWNELF